MGPKRWHTTCALLRNTNEGMNGFLKDPAHEALDDAGRRRIHGRAAQTLFVALLAVATSGDPDPPLMA